jgi:deoxyhypusine synthase
MASASTTPGPSTTATKVPTVATDAVMVKSEQMPEGSEVVKGQSVVHFFLIYCVKLNLLFFTIGYDFNLGVNHHTLLQSYRTSGFQATNFGLAVEQINQMVR